MSPRTAFPFRPAALALATGDVLRARRSAAVAAALLVALGAAGCGSGDDRGAGGPGRGTGGEVPERDEGSVRDALGRTAAAMEQAGTARIVSVSKQQGGQTISRSTGTVDLAGDRYRASSSIGGDPAKAVRAETYVEDGRTYTRVSVGDAGWTVDDATPATLASPVSLFGRLARAEVTSVGDTLRLGGAACRSFGGTLALLAFAGDTASRSEDDAAAERLRRAPDIAIRGCVDGRGLLHAFDYDVDFSKLVPNGKATLKVSTTARMTDYGTAPAPERPAGIDEAEALDG
jgi:hypothetical protein